MASKVRVEHERPARKKRTQFSEEIVQEVLRILTSGDPEELFELIPRLGVLRDARFDKALLVLLSDKDIKLLANFLLLQYRAAVMNRTA